MKRYLLSAILVLISFCSLKSQTYMYIPDSSFRYVLSNVYSCPFSGDSLDIASGVVPSLMSMNCYRRGIHSIEGIQYFTGLRNLYCYENSIDSIVILPPNLELLDCRYNHLQKIRTLPSNLITLDCSYTNLGSLPSLPSSLVTLRIDQNNCPVLPILPAGLSVLSISSCNITRMPALPLGLTNLECSYNNIDSLPMLPSTLTVLGCSYCSLDTILSLPPSLSILQCSGNQIRVLPTLPSTLTKLIFQNDSLLTSLPSLPLNLSELECSGNRLTSLPVLPLSLYRLYCNRNRLDSLPLLPNGLLHLDCSNNTLRTLPMLPPNLLYLFCSEDSLTDLPTLPVTLGYLSAYNNPNLFCIPYLPHSLWRLEYVGTSVGCIPNIVLGATYYPSIGTHPTCNSSISSCPWYTNISGNVHLDSNLDCIMDVAEPKMKNISVFLKQGSSIVNISSSNATGLYAFDSFPFDEYTFDIDTTELPYTLYCPAAGADTARIDTTHTEVSGKHLGLQCRAGFDVGSIGMIHTSWIRPATLASFDVHAGDMSTLYGAACSFIGGTIVINYSGHLNYSGVTGGTLLPDSILPNRLVWSIANFSTLDFFEDIKPIFFVDSLAIAGDLICFTTEVTPGVGDRVPSNNVFSQCFVVRASYDPNIKEVSPSGSVTSAQGWMYYTIHFQNIGSSFAENIYVWDTLDAALNMNSIQVMASSHNVAMNVYPVNRATKFSFIDINLIDSATNEPASHGYVQYRIKLNDSVSEGTLIENTASILFDLNDPVVTNTVTTNICNSPSLVIQNVTILEGESINVGVHTYSTEGVYSDILLNVSGCDSLITTVLNVVSCLLPLTSNQSLTIFLGESITVGTHTYTSSGIYTDTLASYVGCDSVVITTLQVILGIDNVEQGKMTIYPNPANNEVVIQLEGMNNAPLQIFDMYGKLLYENLKYADNYVINTSTFISGSYIIQWGNNHQKLMIKH